MGPGQWNCLQRCKTHCRLAMCHHAVFQWSSNVSLCSFSMDWQCAIVQFFNGLTMCHREVFQWPDSNRIHKQPATKINFFPKSMQPTNQAWLGVKSDIFLDKLKLFPLVWYIISWHTTTSELMCGEGTISLTFLTFL